VSWKEWPEESGIGFLRGDSKGGLEGRYHQVEEWRDRSYKIPSWTSWTDKWKWKSAVVGKKLGELAVQWEEKVLPWDPGGSVPLQSSVVRRFGRARGSQVAVT
jgi:hypothetical protein